MSLDIIDIRKSFGSLDVLKGVNIDAREGEFIALVGPSGCGKSTLLSLIAGLDSITSGEIRIAGKRVNEAAPMNRNIAMVFQSYALYPTMTVRENITFGMECRNVPKERQNAEVARVAQMLQIEPLLGRKPSQLSGGQRQRVAMGRALVRDPALFLFDEPLSNLDAKLRVEMRTEIKRLQAAAGRTTVYVTHDQIEAMTLSSRIAVMNRGWVEQFDEPKVIYNNPRSMFVASFMGSPAMNMMEGSLSSRQGLPAIRIGDGAGSLTLLIPRRFSARTLPDQLVLGIRPEHVRRAREMQEASTDIEIIETRVDVVEPTGGETMVIVKIGGRDMTVKLEADDPVASGEPIRLAIDLARVSLFDRTTGLSLA